MGMASINEAMKNYFANRGHEPIVINLSTRSLSKAWYVRIRRVLYLPFQLFRLLDALLRNPELSVYMGLSSGYGQLFEMPFVFLSRICGARIFLHHHSVLYINRPTRLSRALMRVAGAHSRHIVLCPCMAEKIQASYEIVRSVTSLSNAAVLPLIDFPNDKAGGIKTLGFLSNIELDKGIMEYLEVLKRLESKEDIFQGLVSGPFRASEIEAKVKHQMAGLRHVKYVGPKYGCDKTAFFETIDVLLYPSRNDAEPLIVLEAMAHGVPVIAWGRGCIPDMIGTSAGCVISVDIDYVEPALEKIWEWRSSTEMFLQTSVAAKEKYREMRNLSVNSLETLFQDILGELSIAEKSRQ